MPREQREAALALGATRWETTWQVVVPYAKLGISGSVFLGLARALGETMAVTMVIGNSALHPRLPSSPRAAPSPRSSPRSSRKPRGKVQSGGAGGTGAGLFLLTVVINALARVMIVATTRKGSKR